MFWAGIKYDARSRCFSNFKVSNLLTFPILIPEKERKLTSIFIFTLLCGASKGFTKAFKGLHKTF